MENMKLWKSVCITDPSAVKPITGKQYTGNSPKPYWIIEEATRKFGPCGIGWGLQVMDERVERFGDVDSIHIARVKVWYVLDGKRGEIEQMGQTVMSRKTNAGKFQVDEDAPKKSVTDAMIKCLSMIGFAGDIFSGRWDDSRYVDEAREFHQGRAHEEASNQAMEEAKRIHDILSAAATQGKAVFTSAWRSLKPNERQAFGGAENLKQFEEIVKAADEKAAQ